MKNKIKNSNKKIFDVHFEDCENGNAKGFKENYQDCLYWIETNRNDKSTYFGDYAGGVVQIVNTLTDEIVYEERI